MKRPSICLLTSELSGLNVRMIEALKQCDRIEIKRIIYTEKNRPFELSLLKKKIKKVFRIGIIGAILGFWTRRWYTIRSGNLADTCNILDLPLTKVKFLNSSVTRGLLALDNATFVLSLGNGYIRSDILGLADKVALNIHLEKLPDYPGARSVIWRLHSGEIRTGYAVHTMTSEIDKGHIHNSCEVDIDFKSSLPQTISCSLENLVQVLEQNISQIILDIYNIHADYPGNKLNDALAFKSLTTPSLYEFVRIWLNYRHLRSVNR